MDYEKGYNEERNRIEKNIKLLELIYQNRVHNSNIQEKDRRKKVIDEYKLQLEKFRLPQKEDVEYRKQVIENVFNGIGLKMIEKHNYQFLGCDILEAEDILKNRKSIDFNVNLNENKEELQENILSKKIEDIIINKINLDNNIYLPAGCIFIKEVDNKEEVKNHKKIKYIISTPENIDNLKKLQENSNFEIENVIEFKEFEIFKECKQNEEVEQFFEDTKNIVNDLINDNSSNMIIEEVNNIESITNVDNTKITAVIKYKVNIFAKIINKIKRAFIKEQIVE